MTVLAQPPSRAAAARPAPAPPLTVRGSWPIWLVFGLYPLWWALGLVVALWAVAAVALAAHLGVRRGLRVPPGFALWALFLLWMGVSLFQIDSGERLLAYVYRGAAYACATLLFLYVYNRRQLPSSVVVRLMALFWCYVAIGGVVAVLLPTFNFSTPVEYLLPNGLARNRLINSLVHPQAAQASRFLGFLVGRPVMPFSFTNGWGSAYALSFPFLVLSWRYGTARWRVTTQLLAAASVVPVVLSLNRGLWISLTLGLLYAAVRLLMTGRGRSLVLLLGAATVVGALLVFSPLGSLIVDRADNGHSDAGRAHLYSQALELTAQSPVLGYGAPQPSDRGPEEPSVGTHGQFWLVLVSQGVPGAVLFLSWFAYLLAQALRRRDPLSLWCGTVVVIAIIQIPLYEQLPAPLSITMVAAALILRQPARPAVPAPVAQVPSPR